MYNHNSNHLSASSVSKDHADVVVPRFQSMPVMPRRQQVVGTSPLQRHVDNNNNNNKAWTPLKSKYTATMMDDSNSNNTFSNSVATTSASSTTSCCWSIETHRLPRLGYFHPLAATHVSFAKSDLTRVLSLLTESLANLSCQMTFHAMELTVECHTRDDVVFSVDLYEDSSSSSSRAKKSHPEDTAVYAEIQRRYGDSLRFHSQYARPLLTAVRDLQVVPPPPPSACHTNKENHVPEWAMRRDQLFVWKNHRSSQYDHDQDDSSVDMDDYDDNINVEDNNNMEEHVSVEATVASALDVTATLLLHSNDRWDAQRLGLESLLAMTTLDQSGWSVTCRVVQALVNPTTATERALSDYLTNCLVTTEQGETGDSYGYHSMTTRSVHSLTLRIWTNVWELLAYRHNQNNDSVLGWPLPSSSTVITPPAALYQTVYTVLLAAPQGQTDIHLITLALRLLTAILVVSPPSSSSSFSRGKKQDKNEFTPALQSSIQQAVSKMVQTTMHGMPYIPVDLQRAVHECWQQLVPRQ